MNLNLQSQTKRFQSERCTHAFNEKQITSDKSDNDINLVENLCEQPNKCLPPAEKMLFPSVECINHTI